MGLPYGGAAPYRLDGMPNLDDFQLFPDNPVATIGDFSPFPRPLDFGLFEAALQASDPNDYVPTLDMNIPSIDSSTTTAQNHVTSSGIDASPCDPNEANLNYELNWDNDYTVMNAQLLTPAHSVEAQVLDSFSRNHSICVPSPPLQEQKIPSLSPGGQGSIMLYSPHSHTVDEGYRDYGKPASDFTLFESPMNSHRHHPRDRTGPSVGFGGGMDTTNPMFPPLTSYGPHYVGNEWPDQMDAMDMQMDVDDYGVDDF
jgi:hypothetical protein